MQKLAVLIGQFAVAAAGSWMVMKSYSAEGCSDGDLKNEGVLTVKKMMSLLQADQDKLDICEDKSSGGRAVSNKASCTSGFLVVNTYMGASCAGTPISTVNLECMSDTKGLMWQSVACDVDISGYAEFQYSEYSSKDCAGDPSASIKSARKPGRCLPMAELKGSTWTAKSSKMTVLSDGFAEEDYSTIDCSGEKIDKKFTCGKCKEDDGKNVIYTCPTEVSRAAPPSCILPALILLAAGAKQG